MAVLCLPLQMASSESGTPFRKAPWSASIESEISEKYSIYFLFYLILMFYTHSSLIAKCLNLPRPPGEGRDHDEDDNANVVVEKGTESPITVKVVGRR